MKILYYVLFYLSLFFVPLMGITFVVNLFTINTTNAGLMYIITTIVYLFIYAGLFFGSKEFELEETYQHIGAIIIFFILAILIV